MKQIQSFALQIQSLDGLADSESCFRCYITEEYHDGTRREFDQQALHLTRSGAELLVQHLLKTYSIIQSSFSEEQQDES